jgi:hypothetical protein
MGYVGYVVITYPLTAETVESDVRSIKEQDRAVTIFLVWERACI